LYEDLRKIIIYNVLGAVIGLGVLAYLSNKFIISNAKRLLDRALEERNKFESHANTDSLTGAYSRMFLDHWSERNLNEFEGHLILIDLDCFKKINDKFGHLTGDKVLVKFVEIVKSSIRNEDYLIRYGGDEFIIITDNEDREIVESIVNRIKKKCQSVDEFSFDILMSYGIAKIEENDDINKAIYKADKALYKNKEKRECKEI
jgi:diguanylate cyclase (GGDEF)-like protein